MIASSFTDELTDVFGSHIAGVSIVDNFEKVDQVEVVGFCKGFS